MALGVAAIHNADIMHRDLKPTNVLLKKVVGGDGGESYVVKIADFGLSSAAGGSGAKGWKAPEVLDVLSRPTSGEWWYFEADVFVLGCVFYHTCVNQHAVAKNKVKIATHPFQPPGVTEENTESFVQLRKLDGPQPESLFDSWSASSNQQGTAEQYAEKARLHDVWRLIRKMVRIVQRFILLTGYFVFCTRKILLTACFVLEYPYEPNLLHWNILY